MTKSLNSVSFNFPKEKLQLHIITKKNIEFKACGFFTLDYALINAVPTQWLIII